MDGWHLDEDRDQSFFSSFNSSSCISILGLTQEEVLAACLGLADSDSQEQQYYQVDMNMGVSHQSSMQSFKKYEFQFVPTSDDLALTRVMKAIISSSSSTLSSSPSSSSSSVFYQPPQQVQTHGQSKANCDRLGAFRPYRPSLVPDFKPKNNLSGQKMMKACLSMLRRIDNSMTEDQTRESQSNIQMQHIVSERKRREKLNDNFHTLRSLLPPGSKKDKASVLTNTKGYLSTLKAKISKLEEENTKMEMHLLAAHLEAEEIDWSTDKVKVQITRGAKSRSSGLQLIELKITVRVGCDVIELVLHILECLKAMRLERLISFDVSTPSYSMNQFVQATLTLQIKDYDLDEEWFQEAMSQAVDRVAMT